MVAGERLFFPCKAARRDNFRERHSDPVGTCQDVLRGLHCVFDETDRTQSRPPQGVFKADRNSGRQGSGRQRIGYVDLLGRTPLCLKELWPLTTPCESLCSIWRAKENLPETDF